MTDGIAQLAVAFHGQAPIRWVSLILPLRSENDSRMSSGRQWEAAPDGGSAVSAAAQRLAVWVAISGSIAWPILALGVVGVGIGLWPVLSWTVLVVGACGGVASLYLEHLLHDTLGGPKRISFMRDRQLLDVLLDGPPTLRAPRALFAAYRIAWYVSFGAIVFMLGYVRLFLDLGARP